MKLKKYNCLLLLVASSIASSVYAADSKLLVTGKVYAAACTIDVTGDQVVPLGDIPASKLFSPGSGSDWKTFDVTLSQCPNGTKRVTAKFSGTADAASPTMYANLVGAPYATNVAVQIQSINPVADMGNNTTMMVNVDGATSKAIFKLQARAYTRNGSVTIGDISSAVTMSYTYN